MVAVLVAVGLAIALRTLLALAPKPIPNAERAPVTTEMVLAPPPVESLRYTSVDVPVNTAVPLKVVLLPIRLISALMAVNSESNAVRCVSETVPVADSVASVTARLSRVVTWASEPSATCKLPTPSFAFRADWLRAVILARKPSAIARPAASSAPLLIRDPDESRKRVRCRFDPVIAS